ncbi:RNA polymerase I-specific transcription initiation factor RRN3 [Didymella exigua CBS 183.55]|uniref:RNA polymerase I-specific transcription initiation factor RRN3 n=1 Tax=Didymella exigua CBS 183.55 TaxID=1150837 RepID=A0A6A5S3L4_9PLEO|nr:RNA polymerase I-specific transcription initiation factor RRN3 [Didymella exigua CBS 183.55]KAF1932087.1 RNA polymerase I-specific transcription initiation factor RRN3 [Didymella exigua CBS 183.55]
MVSLAAPRIPANNFMAPTVSSSLKRKQRDVSSDAENDITVQAKRRRVTFDPNIDVQVVMEVEKSMELVAEEVRRAIEKHAYGEKGEYDQLRSLFSESPTAPGTAHSALLQKYIVALKDVVPLLDYNCKGLVHSIIDCSWIARNEHFVQAYRNLLRSLLSVHPAYTSTVLQMLVQMFRETPSTTARAQDDPAIQPAHLTQRIHECLRSFLRQSPMASTYLGPIIANTFPHSSDTAKIHTRYIRNILQISEYCTELKGEILSLVTDKIAKIDVQIQVDMDDLEDDEEELVGRAINDAEGEDMSDNESVSSEESLDPEDVRKRQIQENVNKLDTVMDLLFTHYDAVFAKGDLFDSDELFESLLVQFSNIILPTYRSRHVQFLLFHFSQTSADLTERFAGCCSHLAFDQLRPHMLRVAAAAYLASFIARGAHVSGAVVRDVFDLLCHHLERLRVQQEPGCKGPDLRRYGTYYAICQALLYTFCFRWRDLIVLPDGRTPTDQDIIYHDGDFAWHGSVHAILHKNIFSKLNPLKICAPSIVAQFARMALHLRFLYVYPLLETNKRVRLARTMAGAYLAGIGGRETALTQKRGDDMFLLDAYFPFDPYVLPRSRRWIEHDYVQWTPVPGMPVDRDEEEDDSEADDDDEDDDDDDDEESGASEAEGEAGAEHGGPGHVPEDLDDQSTEASV